MPNAAAKVSRPMRSLRRTLNASAGRRNWASSASDSGGLSGSAIAAAVISSSVRSSRRRQSSAVMPYLSRFLPEVGLLLMFVRRSGRYDANAFASIGPDYHKDAVVKPAEALIALLVRVWVEAIDAVRVIEGQSRLLEREAMIADVASRLPIIPLELVVSHGPRPTIFRNVSGTLWRNVG